MAKDTFWYLVQTFGKYFEKQDMYLRRALAPVKKLAVVLHWLAQASSFYELAALYAILRERLVHNSCFLLVQSWSW